MSSPFSITLSVVIVSYNVRDFVLEGIASLYQYLDCSKQIILVDNASSDNTVEAVKAKFPEVEVLANTNNVGFSAANNQGFKLCKGQYVLLFNPDACLIDNSIKHMIAEIEKYKEQAVLMGPKLVHTDDSFQASCWKFPYPLQHLLELFFLNTIIDLTSYKQNELTQKTKVDFVSGACILLSSKTLAKLGGLDLNLFWMDDVDFCKRNLELGGENRYFPETTVKHHIGQSSKKNQNVVISNQIISKLKFYKKHKQYFYFIVSVPIFVLQILIRIPLFLVLGIIGKQYMAKSKAYVFTFSKLMNYLFFKKQTVI
jgi:GT2 family glycosyltransferase